MSLHLKTAMDESGYVQKKVATNDHSKAARWRLVKETMDVHWGKTPHKSAWQISENT